MIRNRSVPSDTILPHIAYENVAGAVDWLTKTFCFTEHYRYGEPAQGAQMSTGNAWIMLTASRPDRGSPNEIGKRTQSLTVFVEDVDTYFEKVKSAGAKIVEELHETMYGERQFAAEDIEGHHWLFSKHVQDVSPETWGAKLAGG
jgi:uncharacterized glyoxalase superfamily protein PhnB